MGQGMGLEGQGRCIEDPERILEVPVSGLKGPGRVLESHRRSLECLGAGMKFLMSGREDPGSAPKALGGAWMFQRVL